MKVILLGFIIGVASPAAYAIRIIVDGLEYRASLPSHTPTCGMDMLLAGMLILFVSPASGALGASVLWTLHSILKWIVQPIHKDTEAAMTK